MSKAINTFIDTMSLSLESNRTKEQIVDEINNDKEAPNIIGGISKSMKDYALAFCQHQLLQVSHVEVTMADLEQWDKEDA
jgi:hypothetical protein